MAAAHTKPMTLSGTGKRVQRGEDPFKIAIVRDRWLTGFDMPYLQSMIIGKPLGYVPGKKNKKMALEKSLENCSDALFRLLKSLPHSLP